MGEDSAAFEAIMYMENATNIVAKELKIRMAEQM